MSDLQDALYRIQQGLVNPHRQDVLESEEIALVVKAARQVADPNYEAASKAMGNGLYLDGSLGEDERRYLSDTFVHAIVDAALHADPPENL